MSEFASSASASNEEEEGGDNFSSDNGGGFIGGGSSGGVGEDSMSLSSLFRKVLNNYSSIVEGVDSAGNSVVYKDNDEQASAVEAALQVARSCIVLIDKLAMFSRNETVDDVSTDSLKYIPIEYYYAKISNQMRDLYKRKAFISQAKSVFEIYLNKSLRMDLLKESDMARLDKEKSKQTVSRESAELTRNKKI